jgi:hypothetical protein
MTPDDLNRISQQVRDELDAAVVSLAAAYARVLRGAGRHIARRLRAQAISLTAAMLPPDEDEVIPQDLGAKVEKVTAKERAELVKLLIAAYEAQGVAFDVAPTLSATLLEKVGAHATFATEKALRETYRGVIERAALEGLSIPNTAREIVTAVDGVSGSQATALARTDMIGLANGASQAAATDAFAGREDVLKVWLATEDERTRETHVEANGQEVSLNEYFDVGGYPLMYPGDPDGPDEEVINCRCTIIYSGTSAGDEAAEEGEAMTAGAVLSDTYPAAMDTDTLAAAVTITVADEEAVEAAKKKRMPWEGILAIAGSPTSDGRYLIPGEIGARELPLPLAASHESQHETQTVGRIEVIEHIPAANFAKPGWELPDDLPAQAEVIWGTGTFDGSDAAEDALRQLENGVGVSLDLPTERQAIIDATTYEEVDPATVINDENVLDVMFGGVPDGYLRGFAGKIGGLSLASIAAFEETTIRVVDDHAIVASGYAIRQGEDPFVAAITAAALAPISIEPPLAPPRAWFFMEEPDEPTPITIRPDGQFFGHLALWNTCHAGRVNGAYSSCMYAPHSRTNYSQFHLGAILCDDGAEVPIGRLTIGTGHAPIHYSAAKARAHYDNSGTCVAFARARDGLFGIWVCGTMKSDATPEQIRDFRACPPSGDWRNHDGALELQAALAVNTPGFPVPRSQLALAASADSLEISALILGPPSDDDFAEALRAEHLLAREDDVNLLVELGALDLLRDVAIARRK